MTITQGSSISPCLWFEKDLAEAARFYTGIFPNSSVRQLTRDAAEFTLDGLTFRGINGGPADFGFSEAISFSVTCRDQSEVDYYWDALTDGGEESLCGWLRDRFGLSWQIVPTRLYELVSDPDPVRARAAFEAMLRMRRIVIADLEAAAAAAG
jgi:predicted 3-demethylubiquinone-9 3-methyltransferase (glyoxalase superfamily)